MKAVLEFELPEDEREFSLACNAHKMLSAVLEFHEYLRAQYKYIEPPQRDDVIAVREKWFEIMGDILE